MKPIAALLLTLFLVLASAVSAQTTGSQPATNSSAGSSSSGGSTDSATGNGQDGVAGIDPCFIQCASKSIGVAGCNGLADSSCFCKKQSFVDAAGKCVMENCKDVEQEKLAAGVEMLKTVCTPIMGDDYQLKFPGAANMTTNATSVGAGGAAGTETSTSGGTAGTSGSTTSTIPTTSTSSSGGTLSAGVGVNNHTASISAAGNVTSHSANGAATAQGSVQLYGAFAVLASLLLGVLTVF